MNVPPTSPEIRDHIDRLRGMFAVAILLGHAIDLAYGQGAPDFWFQLLMPIRPLAGFEWVVGFIVLSGYCVTRSCQLDARMSFSGYLALRASRLFPLLWACLLLAAALEGWMSASGYRPPVWSGHMDVGSFAINTLGLGGFFGTFGSLAPAYTLSYELLYYVLWGTTWFATGRRHGVALVYASLAAAAGFALSGIVPHLPTGQLRFAFMLFSCWAIGAALAQWLPLLAQTRVARVLAPFRWVFVLAVIGFGFSVARMPLFETSLASALYYILLAGAFAFLTVGFVARTGAVRGSGLDRWLGVLSYPLFLAHGPVIMALATFYRALGLTLPFGTYVLALCAPAIVVAWLLAVAVEQPVMALRRRMRVRAAPGCAPMPVAGVPIN